MYFRASCMIRGSAADKIRPRLRKFIFLFELGTGLKPRAHSQARDFSRDKIYSNNSGHENVSAAFMIPVGARSACPAAGTMSSL